MPAAAHAIVHCWDDLSEDQPMPMLTRKRIVGRQAMISRVFLHKGCLVPMHAHENEQFACVLSGRLRFTLHAERAPDRVEIVVGPGEVLELSSNVPHAAEALEDTVVLDIFSPPSAKTGIDRD